MAADLLSHSFQIKRLLSANGPGVAANNQCQRVPGKQPAARAGGMRKQLDILSYPPPTFIESADGRPRLQRTAPKNAAEIADFHVDHLLRSLDNPTISALRTC